MTGSSQADVMLFNAVAPPSTGPMLDGPAEAEASSHNIPGTACSEVSTSGSVRFQLACCSAITPPNLP